MKVGRIGAGNSVGYVPLQDRLFSTIISQASKARRGGKSEVSLVMKDSPALWKAIDSVREHFEVSAQKSNSVKVTVRL